MESLILIIQYGEGCHNNIMYCGTTIKYNICEEYSDCCASVYSRPRLYNNN